MADWNDTGNRSAVPGANKRPVAPEPVVFLMSKDRRCSRMKNHQEDLI